MCSVVIATASLPLQVTIELTSVEITSFYFFCGFPIQVASLNTSCVHIISLLKNSGHLTCRVSCSLDDASCILFDAVQHVPLSFVVSASWQLDLEA